MANGEIRQQMLTLAEPSTQEQLSAVAQQLNSLYQGLTVNGIQAASAQLETLAQDITKLIVEVIRQSSNILGGEVYRDGLNQVLGEPEFSEVGLARRALRILEERPLLEDLLSRTVLSTDFGGVQVLIGGEGTYEELRDCSIVLARYGHPDLATGTLGVLGPIRMPYGRTISTVRFVANLLSDLVIDLHTE
jgi:heat-inducible transcriptional repressor